MFFSPARPCPGQTEPGRFTDKLPKYDFDAPVIVVVDAKLLDEKGIKRFLTPAGAVVANCTIPPDSIHSVILKATGLMVRKGLAYVDPIKKGITLTPRAQVMEGAQGETSAGSAAQDAAPSEMSVTRESDHSNEPMVQGETPASSVQLKARPCEEFVKLNVSDATGTAQELVGAGEMLLEEPIIARAA